MNGLRARVFWRLTAVIGAVLCALGAAAAEGVKPVSFVRDVAPVFVKQCQGCHGAEKSKGKYRLDSFERLMKAGESKDAPVVAGKPEASAIYRLITAKDEDDRMPQKADPLPAAQVTLVRRWIEEGAKFDGPDAAAPLASMVKDEEHAAPPEVYRQPVAVTALAFSADVKQLAVSGYHEVTLWDPADGKLIGRIQKLAERTTGLAYSPDGRWLAIAGGTPGTLGEVRLCDAASAGVAAGKVLERIGDVMLAVRFSPDGARLAVGGADDAIRVYDTKSGKRELLIEQHADWVTDVAFSPDGLQLASASRDKSARVFDAKTGAMRAAFLAHEEPVFGVAWDEAGKNVFSAGRDRKVRVWNASDAKPVGEITGFGAEPFHIEAWEGKLFCSCADGVVREYSQEKRELVRAYAKAPEWVYCLAVDVKNRRLAAGCYNGEVRVWNTDDGSAVCRFVAAPGYVGKATAPMPR